jgi:hypothetical protein
MAFVKLSDSYHVEPEVIGEVVFDMKYGMAHMELRHRHGQGEPTELYGVEAERAWSIWNAHVDRQTTSTSEADVSESGIQEGTQE